MGKNKIKIQKLATACARQVILSRRRTGIFKKARELSILCDVDVLLLIFSTKGKPSLCLGEKSKFEDIIRMYAALSPQERKKRKKESLEALKKTFKNGDHEVNIDQLNDPGSRPIEEMKQLLCAYRDQITEALVFLDPLGAPQNPPTPTPPPCPRDIVDLSKEIELAEEKLHNTINAGTSYMLNSTEGLEHMENFVLHLMNIHSNMKGTNNEIPMPAAGGYQLTMNIRNPNVNGVLRSLMLGPNTNIRNVDVFAASDSASTSAHPMPMWMQEETSLLTDPLFNPPQFNSIDTSLYFAPSTSASAPLMPMRHLNAAICDVDVDTDDSNLGMGNSEWLGSKRQCWGRLMLAPEYLLAAPRNELV